MTDRMTELRVRVIGWRGREEERRLGEVHIIYRTNNSREEFFPQKLLSSRPVDECTKLLIIIYLLVIRNNYQARPSK